ncbi:uncharacterized protein LOC144123531 [Amblyomma americanum]
MSSSSRDDDAALTSSCFGYTRQPQRMPVRRPHALLLFLVLALLAGNVHGWATLKKILLARLLSGPRVIAVPFPVPTGHHHQPPRPPLHHHHHPHHLPPPPPPPPLVPLAVPIHHYHYPPTNVWESPIRKSPDVTEITDLSHLHALFDAPAEQPAKVTHEHGHIDVVDFSAAAEAFSTSAGKSKASSTQSLPTYSERIVTKRPSYNPYRSDTYYAAETPNKHYTSSATSPYASKTYSDTNYDSYATKALTKATQQRYGPRYLDAADYPAYMAALREYMKEKHIPSLESAWNQQPASYQAGTPRWPSYKSSVSKGADYYSSQDKNYDWAAYPSHSYVKEEDKSASKQHSTPDTFDWAQYVASAYKAAANKASSQSSAAARYDTVSQSSDAYAESSDTTTESSTGSAKYNLEAKQASLSTVASVTSKTPTELEAAKPQPDAAPSSQGVNSTKKD